MRIVPLAFLIACSSSGSTPTAFDKGRQVYLGSCTACHNADPAKDGAVGPAVKGASRELLEARVLRAEYPAGYTPKRTTKAMTALPHLAKSIDDLAAYLK